MMWIGIALVLASVAGCSSEDSVLEGSDVGADGAVDGGAAEDASPADSGADAGDSAVDVAADGGAGPSLEAAWAEPSTPFALGDCGTELRAVHDGAEGLIVACRSREGNRVLAQRVLADGSTAWDTPLEVVVAPTRANQISMREDEARGPVVAVYTDGDVRLQRVAPDGTIGFATAGISTGLARGFVAPGYGADSWLVGHDSDGIKGVRVDRDLTVGPVPDFTIERDLALAVAPDGEGGVYVLHREPATSSVYPIAVTRESGTSWTATATGAGERPSMRADRSGIWVAWDSDASADRGASVMRILADGVAAATPLELGPGDFTLASDDGGRAWVFRHVAPIDTITVDVLAPGGELVLSTTWSAGAGVVVDAVAHESGDLVVVLAREDDTDTVQLYARLVAPDGTVRMEAPDLPLPSAAGAYWPTADVLVPLGPSSFGVVFLGDIPGGYMVPKVHILRVSP